MNEHYAAVLADLEQMKADAEDGIRAIKRLMSRILGEPSVTEPTTSKQKPTVPTTAITVSEQPSIPTLVLQMLAEQPNRSFRFQEIFERMPDVNAKTLRGALSRLGGENKIGKHGRGRYRALRNRQEVESESSTAAA